MHFRSTSNKINDMRSQRNKRFALQCNIMTNYKLIIICNIIIISHCTNKYKYLQIHV